MIAGAVNTFSATSFFGDTTAGRGGGFALRAAGACSLPNRTYRRACPAASNLNRNYEAIGIAGWRYFSTLVSMRDSLRPDGAAIRAIRTPPDVKEPVPMSSRRRPPRRGPPYGLSGPYGKFSITVLQRLPAGKKTVSSLVSEPLFWLQDNRRELRLSQGNSGKSLIRSQKIIL